MANHKSALKRIRSNEAKRQRNKYQHKTARTVLKNARGAETKADAEVLTKSASAHLDKLVKKNIIHKNKAANIKSQLAKKLNSMK